MIAQPRWLGPGRSGPRANIQVVRRHFGCVPYGHIHGYASALLHKQDGYFEQAPASRATFALALLIGLWKNGLQAGRFWKEAVVHTRFGGPRSRARVVGQFVRGR